MLTASYLGQLPHACRVKEASINGDRIIHKESNKDKGRSFLRDLTNVFSRSLDESTPMKPIKSTELRPRSIGKTPEKKWNLYLKNIRHQAVVAVVSKESTNAQDYVIFNSIEDECSCYMEADSITSEPKRIMCSMHCNQTKENIIIDDNCWDDCLNELANLTSVSLSNIFYVEPIAEQIFELLDEKDIASLSATSSYFNFTLSNMQMEAILDE